MARKTEPDDTEPLEDYVRRLGNDIDQLAGHASHFMRKMNRIDDRQEERRFLAATLMMGAINFDKASQQEALSDAFDLVEVIFARFPDVTDLKG